MPSRTDRLSADVHHALAHLIALIVVINGWNRLMVARRTPPGGLVWQ